MTELPGGADLAIEVREGDIIKQAVGGALVSPANSFGFMDGGLDDLIRRAYAKDALDISHRVQRAIQEDWAGEIPVGAALIVPTPGARFTHLICAPTMRTPRPVPRSLNAYLAFRAVLLAVRRWEHEHPDSPLRQVFCPGLATGVGRMPPKRAARQMCAAWDSVTRNPTSVTSLLGVMAKEAPLRVL